MGLRFIPKEVAMNSINFSTIINQYVFDFDEVSGIH